MPKETKPSLAGVSFDETHEAIAEDHDGPILVVRRADREDARVPEDEVQGVDQAPSAGLQHSRGAPER